MMAWSGGWRASHLPPATFCHGYAVIIVPHLLRLRRDHLIPTSPCTDWINFSES
jgi:hypothetical protein